MAQKPIKVVVIGSEVTSYTNSLKRELLLALINPNYPFSFDLAPSEFGITSHSNF